jgi:predicted MFS family arabinose efflux permease
MHAPVEVDQTRRRLLTQRPFQLLWLGEGISLVGDQLHLVALSWITLELTGSPSVLGSILALTLAARALCMLLGGVLADRVSAQRVLVFVNLLRAGLGALLTTVVLLDVLAVWQLAVFGIAFGLLDALFQPAYLAAPSLLVQSSELSLANATLQATRRGCEVLGPFLGGVVLKLAGPGAAFGADAASFALAAALFSSLRIARQVADYQPVPLDVGSAWRRAAAELWDGLKAVLRDSELRLLMVAVTLVNLMVGGPLAVGLPTLARTRFAADPLAFGLLLAAFGAGALLGTVLAGLYRTTSAWWRWTAGLSGLFALCFAVVSQAERALVAALAVMLAGAGAGFVLVLIFTRFQQRSLPAMRGRAMGVLVCASFSCGALSNALAGIVAERDVGLLFVGASGLLLCLLAGLGLARLLQRRLR